MKDISILLAFSAGLLSFLSPCVLPLVPAYISYLTGSSIKELKEGKTKLFTLYKSFGFVLGFSIIFILMGVSVTSLGKLFITHKDLFRKFGGILIIVFGLHTTGVFKIKPFYQEKRFLHFDKIKGPFSSIIIGMAFAAGWTPCIGPILSSILIYAANMDSMDKGILLLIMYSIGLAVPFILTALAIEGFAEQFKKFSKYLPIVSTISGILMVIMGIMIFTNKLAILSQYSSFINF
ncbi:cytochrome c biogenesis CcdA family protein [Clostridium beijerinckii]|uniref:Cytochrome c-type biogenesis protein n=1 Tax=Clostridium beijerinckii TaxID=1520 RepID=A0AAX0B0J2_CLOBE|nr:cytochrome c biogenesis protein CcdA [Clostridium beijerinckii]MBA8935108.1 cytochrome c-type biogenesis protein [Clostridium beijerinckii]NRT34777.1 cytochrome c-type biogenesis protein [Clostridium beijerinckii]NRT45794.1 cytochrome c-type biogenesis protein [Clostridium beijerinckii]NRT71390.1 cytochrome c-type biogenesis protein [Clostridium beijerinckii]NRT87878.1 cytochrome c-type biogenesis protein [Clostridium beijerinckii]